MSVNREDIKREYLKLLYKNKDRGLYSSQAIARLRRAGFDLHDKTRIAKPEAAKKGRHGTMTTDRFLVFKQRNRGYPFSEEDWKPTSTILHTTEFYDWINSMTNGYFPDKIRYDLFEKYKAQAQYFMETARNPYDTTNIDLRRELVLEEYRRIDQNTLYFSMKYGKVKEGSVKSGKIDYVPKEHNAVLFYLMDCGYSFIFGKPRQIFATTTVGIFVMKKLVTQENFYMKFITEDIDTGMEILSDKLKVPYGYLPAFMRPQVSRDYIKGFKLGRKVAKGDFAPPNSRIEVVAPSKTAINGGSPQVVLVDEVGNVPNLIPMILEAMPTMYTDPKQDGNLQLVRQCCLWGCVCAGTKVWNNDGKLINIEDLKQEEGILGFDKEKGCVSKEEITYWQPPFEKPCYRITTKSGRILECSEDHPIYASYKNDYKFFRENGKRNWEKKVDFIETKDLQVGDQVAFIEEVSVWGNKTMKDPRFIGYMIGDGNYGTTDKTRTRQPRFYNCDKEILQHVESNYDVSVFNQYTTKDGREYKEIAIRGIAQMLRDVGIYGQSGKNKRLPRDIGEYTEHDSCELIGGLFDTDGCVHKQDVIDMDSSSEDMLIDTMFLLQKIGVSCSINKIKARISNDRKDKNDYYRLSICDETSIIRFAEKIKLTVGYKQDRLNEKRERLIDKKTKRSGKRSRDHKGIYFEPIIKKEYIGIKPVYNLTAGTTNTYIANGIITHNTGVSDNQGKNGFQSLWTTILDNWEKKNFTSSIFVPLFFSWHTRCSGDLYEQAKHSYYSGGLDNLQNFSMEEQKNIFHMHYPSVWRDMFAMATNKLISRKIIEENIRRIRASRVEDKPIYGWFEPIYDRQKPLNENIGVPYEIIGSRFVPYDDNAENLEKISAIMRHKPEKGWIDRYYQGTDPIATETGLSKFASVMWDEENKTIPCIVNFRKSQDHKAAFLQALLMSIYYDTENFNGHKVGVPELIENNIGINYKDYKDLLGYGNNLIYNKELPENLQGGGAYWGVNSKQKRKEVSVSYLSEVVTTYAENIDMDIVFKQLDTYVPVAREGGTNWQPVDKRLYNDDVLDALAYAYVARLSAFGRQPKNIGNEQEKRKANIILVDHRLPDGTLTKIRKEVYI